ncbi:putative lipoprotein [Cocos nucifera]|nr:putative lipoprotein [Cocos nucifera]
MSSLPQPMVAYPHSISTQPSSYSKGSFGPVFIVLAIIAVLATIACVVGRLCARRLSRPKLGHEHRSHAAKGDIEDVFELKIPTMKPRGEKGTKDEAKPAGKSGPKGSAIKHPETDGARGEGNHGASAGAKTSK